MTVSGGGGGGGRAVAVFLTRCFFFTCFCHSLSPPSFTHTHRQWIGAIHFQSSKHVGSNEWFFAQ